MSKVAVITRTKDRPVFLERALRSVHSQTYTDFIHVIVNDGGDKDEVAGIVESFKETVKAKVKLFHREISSGAPDTIFNESIDRVDSEYFVIHDDDDTWHPEFLERTVSRLDTSTSLGAVVVRAERVDEVINGTSIKLKKQTRWMPDLKVISLYRQCIDNQFTPIATLFRREAYKKVGKFDSSLPIVGDWEFGVRLLSEFDAEFTDPGYALAFYHHRERTGGSQDSVSEKEKHRYYTNLVMNRYLRKELKSGRLGVGYIMSNIRYSQDYTGRIIRRTLPAFITKLIQKRVRN